MNYKSNSDANYKEFSQAILGTNYYAVDSSGFDIPNGIVSKWPITSSGYWDDPTLSNRELMWGIIDIPGPVDIFAISVHLHTDPASDQIEASLVIVDAVKTHRLAHPGEYYYVVGGDFNGTSSVSTNGFGKDSTFYVSAPHPVDDEGTIYTNANRDKHYDFVLGDYTMHGFQIPVVYNSVINSSKKTYTNGLVFDTRTFSQSELDEYFPDALTSDSGASSMQHMAIVKDYFID
ncbi:MAG TPA: endonuclease, partial [bacterium]|nr:endonuclease [bacterium]